MARETMVRCSLCGKASTRTMTQIRRSKTGRHYCMGCREGKGGEDGGEEEIFEGGIGDWFEVIHDDRRSGEEHWQCESVDRKTGTLVGHSFGQTDVFYMAEVRWL